MPCKGYRLYIFIALFFVLIGLSFIIAGLVIAWDITSGVEKQVQDRYCIDSKDHPSYNRWAYPPPYQTLLYFWDVLNGDDMLYNSKIPKVAERGPYVYKTTARKIDVVFDKQGRVTYKEFIQQEFDKNATKQRCPDCNENDKLTVVNQKFFELLHTMNWDTRVATFFIPGVLQRFLLKMDNKTGGRNATYARIGRFQPSPMPSTHPNLSVEFGQFVMKNMARYPELQFHFMQRGRDYNETEMRGLYEAFAETSFSFEDGYSFYVCYTTYKVSNCGIANYLYHYSRFIVLKQKANLTPEEAKVIDTDIEEVTSKISRILCPSKTRCFPFDPISFSVLSVFFAHSLLPLAVINTVEKSFVFNKRNQKDLALGYIDPHYPFYPEHPDGIPVAGYLVHDVDANATRQRGKKKSFYTCSGSKDKSFIWAEYRDHTGVFTSGVETPFETIKGYNKQLPPASKISPCQKDFKENLHTLKLFLPELHQVSDLYFAGMSKPSGTSVHNLRYNLDITAERGNVTFNGTLLDDARVIDVSGINGFASVASLPYFVDSRRSFRKRHNISDPDIENCRCYVDLEPLTGQIVAAKIRSQVSAALTKSNIIETYTQRTRPINMGYTNPAWPGGFKYIPVYWTEKAWTVDQSEVAEFYQTLDIACQITVYLPTAGGAFILAAVIMLVLVIKHRANSVAAVDPPLPE